MHHVYKRMQKIAARMANQGMVAALNKWGLPRDAHSTPATGILR